MNLNKKEKEILKFYIKIQIYNLKLFINKEESKKELEIFNSILFKLDKL